MSSAAPFEHQWYAACLSEEVGRRKPHGIRLHGVEIVLWRRRDGILAAMDARCPHMGASLALGRVIGETVSCPYHGFRYQTDGRCVHTPLRPAGALIPRPMRGRHYAVRERAGWVFLFWGEADTARGEPPWFEEVGDGLQHAWTAREWPVHFTRFIENTVDVAHLATVHKGTLSWSVPAVADVRCEVDGNLITMFPPSTTSLPVISRIAYPNLALLRLHPRFLTVFVGVPLGGDRTRIYVRSSQGMVRWPLLGRLVTRIKHWADMAALWQDERPLMSVEPRNTDDASGEVLVEFDVHVAEYRKLRRQRLAEAVKRAAVGEARTAQAPHPSG